MELVSLKGLSSEVLVDLLKELGYNSDGTYVKDSKGNDIMDPYIEEPVTLENMMILPGSEVIIDNNPVSIANYLEDYKDIF